jgi:GrpB-like predicted nucleotidyltransferase (UPF0157 family)
MIGLKPGTVALSAPDPAWRAVFYEESARIIEAVRDFVVAIEHVGSTAIPGLQAKPIIDIAAATPTFEGFFPAVPRLEKLGYTFRGEFGIPRRHFFTLGDPVTVHFHVFEEHGKDWPEQLRFRDAMRASEKLRAEYEALKVELAAKFANDRPAYTAAKSDFIQRVLREAAAAAAGTR